MIRLEEIIQKLYGFKPSKKMIEDLKIWHEMFLKYNSHTNLMSKNDAEIVMEKHVLDSLSIVLFEGFKNTKLILDVGCGGGFPSLILAIFFPDKKIIGADSTLKKINFLNMVKDKLELENLMTYSERIENLKPLNVDMITNRAVGKIDDVWQLSKKHLIKGGYFVSYKAKTAEDEANCAIKKFKELKNPEFISYRLPIDETMVRKLAILQKAI